MFDLLGFKVMLGKSALNLFDGDRVVVVEKRPPPPPPPPPRAPSIPADPEEELEVYLRKSLSNSSSSKEGNAVSVEAAEGAFGVVGVDLEVDEPEELVEGVRRCRGDVP